MLKFCVELSTFSFYSKLSSAETQITEVKLENEKLKERIKELEDKLESKQGKLKFYPEWL